MKKIALELARLFPDEFTTVDYTKVYSNKYKNGVRSIVLEERYSAYITAAQNIQNSPIIESFTSWEDLEDKIIERVPDYKRQIKRK